MPTYDKDALTRVEERLSALEDLCPTKEEQEINQFLIQVVRAIRMTLWLTNGAVKYLAGPTGVIIGLWIWGENILDWLLSHVHGPGK